MGSGEGLGAAEPSQQGNPNKHPSSTKVMSAGLRRAQRPVISNGRPCNRQRKKREGRATSKELTRGKSGIWRKLGFAEPTVPRNDSWGVHTTHSGSRPTTQCITEFSGIWPGAYQVVMTTVTDTDHPSLPG